MGLFERIVLMEGVKPTITLVPQRTAPQIAGGVDFSGKGKVLLSSPYGELIWRSGGTTWGGIGIGLVGSSTAGVQWIPRKSSGTLAYHNSKLVAAGKKKTKADLKKAVQFVAKIVDVPANDLLNMLWKAWKAEKTAVLKPLMSGPAPRPTQPVKVYSGVKTIPLRGVKIKVGPGVPAG